LGLSNTNSKFKIQNSKFRKLNLTRVFDFGFVAEFLKRSGKWGVGNGV